MLVKKDWQNIYSGLPKEGNYKDDLNYSPKDGKDESLYVMDEQPYHIQQMNFTFSDGSVGQVFNIYQCGADCTADQETGGADYYKRHC